MAKDDAAELAFAQAVELIAKARHENSTRISFDHPRLHALDRLPAEMVQIEGIVSVALTNTNVSDISSLSNLHGLKEIRLGQTRVRNIAPLAELYDLRILWLDQTLVSDLSPLRQLSGLLELRLNQTKVSDLKPLSGILGLQELWLNQTNVSDVSALANLTGLHTLSIEKTEVGDLRPLHHLTALGDGDFSGLWFDQTEATLRDKVLAQLAENEDNWQRTKDTLAYLKTLPPWPEPLPWLAAPDRPVLSPAAGEVRPLVAAQSQLSFLLRNALVSRITAQQFAEQIEAALRGIPATEGNQMPVVLQTMAEVAEVLRALAPAREAMDEPLEDARLRLRIGQLEAIVEKLTGQLADEVKLREAAEALATKDGFGHSFRKSAGLATGAACVGLVSVGVPSAVVYFLGAEHPMVQAVLTVLGRVPKG